MISICVECVVIRVSTVVSVVGVFALKTSEIDGFMPFLEWDVSFDKLVWLSPMFVERKVGYSGLFPK